MIFTDLRNGSVAVCPGSAHSLGLVSQQDPVSGSFTVKVSCEEDAALSIVWSRRATESLTRKVSSFCFESDVPKMHLSPDRPSLLDLAYFV